MSALRNNNFGLEAALGNVAKYGTVNKFGLAPDCDSGISTDVWDGADGATGTKIWVPPTIARVHDVKSTDTDDTAAGTGMRTVRVFGLTDWDTKEVSEDITLNGTTNVATVNSYVIIHRVQGLTFGTSGSNEGVITVTAQTDNTVTAAIHIGEGQSLMAIYGVPSVQCLAVNLIRVESIRSTVAPVLDCVVKVRTDPGEADSGYLTKDRFTVTGNNYFPAVYDPPNVYDGPCIIKIQVISSTNNTQATAAFNAYLVDL